MPASACRETARLAPGRMRSSGVRDQEPCLKYQRIFAHRASWSAGPTGSSTAPPNSASPNGPQTVFPLGPHRIVFDEIRRHGGRRSDGQLPAGVFQRLGGTAATRPPALPVTRPRGELPPGRPASAAGDPVRQHRAIPAGQEQHLQTPGEIGQRLGQLPCDLLQPLPNVGSPAGYAARRSANCGPCSASSATRSAASIPRWSCQNGDFFFPFEILAVATPAERAFSRTRPRRPSPARPAGQPFYPRKPPPAAERRPPARESVPHGRRPAVGLGGNSPAGS